MREIIHGINGTINKNVRVRKGDKICITLTRGNRGVKIATIKIFNENASKKKISLCRNVYEWDDIHGDDKEDVSFIRNEYEMKQFISVISCIIGREIEHVLFSKEWNEHIWVVR